MKVLLLQFTRESKYKEKSKTPVFLRSTFNQTESSIEHEILRSYHRTKCTKTFQPLQYHFQLQKISLTGGKHDLKMSL